MTRVARIRARRVVLAAATALLALTLHAQTRIASDAEIRQMEDNARNAPDFGTKVAAYMNLGEIRKERNEPAAAQSAFETAMRLARTEQFNARRDRDAARYANACSSAALALAGLGRGAEAFAMFEESVRYDADSPTIWSQYALAMYRLGHVEKSVGVARIAVDTAGREAQAQPTVRNLLTLNIDRFSLASGLLDLNEPAATDEAERLLLQISEALESDAFRSLRKSIAKKEEFQIVTIAMTESSMYIALFSRTHLRLGRLYELGGSDDKARREFEAVISRRSDEPLALGALARLARDDKERERYLILSLDANPFAADVIDEYERLVTSGSASEEKAGGSVGSRVRAVIRQLDDRDFRRARTTLNTLLESHPRNDVLMTLLARVELQSGNLAAARALAAKINDEILRSNVELRIEETPAERPSFLAKPVAGVATPHETDLRTVLSLFVRNEIPAADRATLDAQEFSSSAVFDAPEGELFSRGTIQNVPFRFPRPARFARISPSQRKLKIVYRILGASVVDGRDALLIEPIRAEAGE